MPGPFFIRMANGADNNSSTENKNRNREFENTIGNLLVAEWQVQKLRQRVKSFHMSASDSLSSDFMYKLDEQWFRISITAEKYTIPTTNNDTSEKEKEEPEQYGEVGEEQQDQTTGFTP